MKKRILIYIDSLNASGGIERIVYELIKHWTENYEIHLLTKDDGKCFYGDLKNVQINSINSPRIINMKNRVQRIIVTLKNTIDSILKIKKKRVNDYDYYYVTTPMNAFELFASGVNPQKIVVSEHGSAYGVNKIYKIVKGLVYPRVHCISIPNRMDVDYYKELGANAIYVPHLVYMKNKGENNLQSKIILNCGRLTADKRQMDLLKIWKSINDKNGWKLYIVGNGEEKNALLKFIQENNMSKDVELMQVRKDIESVYRKASIFAFTSRYEGFGLVLVEAMSYGIPCIAFDCPSGPRDIVQNERNGFLIENNNLQSFADKLELMINMDDRQLKHLGKNAYNFVNSWDNETILVQWQKIFA